MELHSNDENAFSHKENNARCKKQSHANSKTEVLTKKWDEAFSFLFFQQHQHLFKKTTEQFNTCQ